MHAASHHTFQYPKVTPVAASPATKPQQPAPKPKQG
jgi:hypothetical protein